MAGLTDIEIKKAKQRERACLRLTSRFHLHANGLQM